MMIGDGQTVWRVVCVLLTALLVVQVAYDRGFALPPISPRVDQNCSSLAPPPAPPPSPPPPPPPTRLISYSFYGDHPRYTVGAEQNADLALALYPDWTVRFYHDSSVPRDVLERLKTRKNVELVDMSATVFNKMMWRFLPLTDPNVTTFIVRDVDSRLSIREKWAVDEWLLSKKHFHVMHDHPSHSGPAISGGMWGHTGEPLDAHVRELIQNMRDHGYVADMNWLGDVLWPVMSRDNDVLVHDAFSCRRWNALPFPMPRIGWEHVGSVIEPGTGKERQGDVNLLIGAGVSPDCTKYPEPLQQVLVDVGMHLADVFVDHSGAVFDRVYYYSRKPTERPQHLYQRDPPPQILYVHDATMHEVFEDMQQSDKVAFVHDLTLE